ncbi:MAG: hypothetical protein MO853_10325 [Candidatus Protistobacter heckmanni]|nr:hypothetical protein [Candidatus Protistobacter heckmanni]
MLMLIMGLGTALIGCLPTYETVGVWAPIMLITMRLVLEHASHGKRGFYGSLVQIGFPLGLAPAFPAQRGAGRAGHVYPHAGAGVASVRADEGAEAPGRAVGVRRGVQASGAFLSTIGLKLSEVSWV